MNAAPDDLAGQLTDWLAIDSTSGREAAFLEALEAHFGARGWRVERQPVADERWNLLVRRPDAAPRLVFSTHVDTVPPYIAPRREADTIFGRGACDTKGGIVAMERAGRRLLADGLDAFGYLFVVGEEVDHIGARVAKALDWQPERIVLCEPTRNRIVAAQKGMIKLDLTATGTAAHSAFPHRGVSAVHRLLDAIAALRMAGWPTDETLGPTTINVGTIAGGVAANVLAPEAHAQLLYRTVSPTAPLLERIEALVASAGDGGVEAHARVYNDPVFFEPPDDADFATCTVAFNTDATYLGELGPIWLVGPGDIEVAHSDHEHITLDSLQEGIALYERLARLVLD